MAKTVKVRELAYARAGDKGNVTNVFLIPYRGNDVEILDEQLTTQRVNDAYGELVGGAVEKYLYPNLPAINFVLSESLGGGATQTLSIDTLGRNQGVVLQELEVEVPDDFRVPERVDGEKEWIR